MRSFIKFGGLIIIFILKTSCNIKSVSENSESNLQSNYLSKRDILHIHGAPNKITRSIVQDKSGNLWFATFEGVFKYDGIVFSNLTKEFYRSPFFSSFLDSENNLWFGSIGSGVYLYNRNSFKNFSTTQGLVSNEIFCIQEDSKGNIWFGGNGGASVFDGDSFRNFILKDDFFFEDLTKEYRTELVRPPFEVNTIIEDKSGKIWIGTKGETYIYDGIVFKKVTTDGKPFLNIRSIREDSYGNIWLGGNDGLWRFNGIIFDRVSNDFTGYIYEDKSGKIWTSSQSLPGDWKLSSYDNVNLEVGKINNTIIKSGEGMIFGIIEDSIGNIWTGTLTGVRQYNSNNYFYVQSSPW